MRSIAERFDTTINSLIEANEIADPNLIRTGSVLLVPASTTVAEDIVDDSESTLTDFPPTRRSISTPRPTPTPTPELTSTPVTKMYWTDWSTGKIQRANLDGSGVEDLVTGMDRPIGIALDVTTGKIYWVRNSQGSRQTGKIQRANFDGSGVEVLVTSALDDPIGIALDLATGKVYWGQSSLGRTQTGKIQRANLDGSGVEDLVTGLETPSGVALDLVAGKVYWTDWGLDSGLGKVQRANLDGSGIENLVTGLDRPEGIALDLRAGKMYWTDAAFADTIQRANLDGSEVEDLVTGLSLPSGIALDLAAGKMYWTSQGLGKIRRANFDGSGIEDLVTGLDTPMSIVLGPDVPRASTPIATPTPKRTVIDDPSTPRLPIRVTLRDWSYEILELVWDPGIEDGAKVAEQILEPQGRFLLVVFRLENRRSSESSVNAWDFMVGDSTGHTYDVVTLGISASDSSFNPSYAAADDRGLRRFDESVRPGRSITTGMLFYIHPNAGDLKLQLFGGLFADSKSIAIGDAPSVLISSPVSDATPRSVSDPTQSPTAILIPDPKAKIESSLPLTPTPDSDNVDGTESQGLPRPAATSPSIEYPPERGAPIGTTLAMIRPGWELTVLSVNPNATDARSFGELWSGWNLLTAWVRITRKDEHSDDWFNPRIMLFARARDKDERNRSHVYGGANESCKDSDALESREFSVGESVEGTICWKVLEEDANRLVMRGYGSFYSTAPNQPRWQLYE